MGDPGRLARGALEFSTHDPDGSVARFCGARGGGLRAYQRSIPLFLGMILGEFLVDGAFSLAGTLLKVRTYIWYG